MKTKQGRFDSYNPYGDLGEPETVGLIANDNDYDLGTPNMTRSENISLMAANSTLDKCVVLRIKWRPNADGKTVTTISKLTFIIDENVYEYGQVECYTPSSQSVRPGRILQYGSSASKLKLFVMSPYRRTRILFNGHMRHVSGPSYQPTDVNQEPNLVYLKLSCIVIPVSQIFDFYGRADEKCLKEIYNEKKPSLPFNSVLSDLVLHDRHEQRIRLNGEYLLIDDSRQPSVRRQESLEISGYHNRHFLISDNESKVETVRLYAFVNNGQGFQIGTRKLDDKNEIDFGYTAFHVHPVLKFIEKPFKVDGKLEADMKEFSLEVSGQQLTFNCTGKRQFADWFKLEMNGKPGWAWLSPNDELIESQDESLACKKCRDGFESALKLGKICRPVELDPNQKQLVVLIEDECCGSSGLVGAKASSLAHLHQFIKSNETFKYQVPNALVLTRFAYDLVIEENPSLIDAIEELRKFITGGNLTSLRDECKKVQDLVTSISLPKRIADELWQQLTSSMQASDELTFAVRSSSWGEDEADMSAAGQLSTILNVKYDLDELSKAVMSCFASKFSAENIEYKRQHGQPVDLPMAVVVQRMISCDKAGVMFTCDPTSGDESVVTITANYGLGESVVSAQADPDSIKVAVKLQPGDYSLDMPSDNSLHQDSFTIQEVTVGKKEVIVDGHVDDSSNSYDKSKCCLSDEEILELAKCGQEIKRYFWSQRRDIEWGYKDGQLYLFQSRPVTGLESFTQEELYHEMDKCPPGELNFFTRANVGEVMPSAVRPLTLSYMVSSWGVLGYRMLAKFLPDPPPFTPQVAIDFSYQKYHSLFNCRNSMMLSVDDKKSVVAKSMEIGLFGREIGPRPDIVESSRGYLRAPQPFEGPRFQFHTWQFKLMPVRTVEKELYTMLKLRQDVRDLKLATGYDSNKLLGLYNQFCASMRFAPTCWINHIVIIILATNSNVVLSAILSKYIHDPMQLCAATNRFLAISEDVVSAEIPKRMQKMAGLVKDKSVEEAQKFASMQVDDALKYVMSEDESNKSVKSAFEEFMTKFGHRCYNEFDLSAPAWRENPTEVVEMIQKNCSALLTQTKQEDKQRDKTIDDVLKSLNIENLTFKDRMLIKHVIAPKCQLMLSLREKTKNILVMYTDVVRECSRMLAAEMVRQQRIPDQDLLYYIGFDELKPLVTDHQPVIVMQATRRRQLFKRVFSELWKFDEIFTEVIPLHMKPTKELDEAVAQAPKLMGTPASSGRVQGKICRVEGYKDLDKVRSGTILLTHSTDIAFSPVFPMITGIITEVGGLISHGAVVAREYGLPSLIGIPEVMRILEDGEEIILDADNGTIIRLSKSDIPNQNGTVKEE